MSCHVCGHIYLCWLIKYSRKSQAAQCICAWIRACMPDLILAVSLACRRRKCVSNTLRCSSFALDTEQTACTEELSFLNWSADSPILLLRKRQGLQQVQNHNYGRLNSALSSAVSMAFLCVTQQISLYQAYSVIWLTRCAQSLLRDVHLFVYTFVCQQGYYLSNMSFDVSSGSGFSSREGCKRDEQLGDRSI